MQIAVGISKQPKYGFWKKMYKPDYYDYNKNEQANNLKKLAE